MAQKQISRIQHRRGPLVDLSGVFLNAGELGWAVDERRLFIGNRQEEGAPEDANIEILTEFSSVLYEYVDDTTVERSILDRLRDRVSIADFGLETFNSSGVQTTRFQEAADFLYNPLFDGVTPHTGAALFVPADDYSISLANYSTDGTTQTMGIRLYPNSSLVGEGPDTTVLAGNSSLPLLETTDNTGQNGANLTTLVENIIIKDMTFRMDTGAGSPLVLLKNAFNVWFINCRFIGTGSTAKAIDWTRDTITDDLGKAFFVNCEFDSFASIVDVTDSTNLIDGLYFDRCLFSNSTNGVTVRDGVKNVHITNSKFDNITNVAFDIQTTDQTGHVSAYNLYLNCGTGIQFNASSFENVSNMDTFESTTTNVSFNDAFRNIVFGTQENYGLGSGAKTDVAFSTTGATTTFLTVATATVTTLNFEYSIVEGSAERSGTFRVISDGTSVVTDDDYIEVGGNSSTLLSASMSGSDILIEYNTSTAATFRYGLRAWLN